MNTRFAAALNRTATASPMTKPDLLSIVRDCREAASILATVRYLTGHEGSVQRAAEALRRMR